MGNAIGALMVAAGVYGFVHVFAEMIHRSARDSMQSRERTAVVLERQRIAREMHDNVAQTLFFVSVKLKDVDAMVVAGEQEQAHLELQTMEVHLDEAYQKVRTVIADLKEQAELQEFGDAVRRVAAQTGQRLGLKVNAEVQVSPKIPAAHQQHLLAIIGEALTNAHRHGQAHSAAVRVRTEGSGVAIEITDDGKGFETASMPNAGRFGMEIMAERARMVGGDLHVESAPGRGTRIVVHLPEVVQ